MKLVGVETFLHWTMGMFEHVRWYLIVFKYRWAKHVEGYAFKHHVGNNKEYFYHRTRVIHWISHLVGWNSIGFPSNCQDDAFCGRHGLLSAADMVDVPPTSHFTKLQKINLAKNRFCYMKIDLKFDTRDRGFGESCDTQQRVKDT